MSIYLIIYVRGHKGGETDGLTKALEFYIEFHMLYGLLWNYKYYQSGIVSLNVSEVPGLAWPVVCSSLLANWTDSTETQKRWAKNLQDRAKTSVRSESQELNGSMGVFSSQNLEREKFGEKIPQEKHRKTETETETDRDIQTERKRTVTVNKHIIS